MTIDEEIAELQRQEDELTRKKLEVYTKQREMLRLAALEKVITVTITLATNDKSIIVALSEFRKDIIDKIGPIPSRYYDRITSNNLYAIEQYETVTSKLKECKNVSIVVADAIEKRIHDLLFMADYNIGMDSKNFLLRLSPKANYHLLLNTIPSVSLKKDIYSIPLIEGWRLSKFLIDKTVVYEAGVEEFIAEQIEKRNFLGELKLQEDCEYIVDIGEYQLTGRQKVGAKFIEDAGSCILADPMGAGKSIQSLAPVIRNGERVLILCPAQLVLNWMYEIKKYTGENPYIMQGTEPKPFHYVELLYDKKQYNIINYESIAKLIELDESYFDEVGIKHERRREKWLWIDLLKQSAFDRIIVDEAHYIKNMDSLRSRATRALIN